MARPMFGKVETLGPWTAHIQAMDQALLSGDPGESVRTWRQAYSAALSHPGWLGLLTVASASLRLAAFPGLSRDAAARARETYWIALFRAHREGSLAGVLETAEGFGVLGDRNMVEQCIRIAEGLATRAGHESGRAYDMESVARDLRRRYFDVPMARAARSPA